MRFVLGFDDGLVQVWKVEGVKSFELRVHETTISKISWNNHGATDLFFACADKVIILFSFTISV